MKWRHTIGLGVVMGLVIFGCYSASQAFITATKNEAKLIVVSAYIAGQATACRKGDERS